MDKVKKYGRCCCRCCPSFEAKFYPNKENAMVMLNRPPVAEDSFADQLDGSYAKPNVLTIKEVDLCFKENGTEHHTSQYESMNREKKPQLVLRRGQCFTIVLKTNRAFNPETDGISFIVVVVDSEKPNYGQGTLGIAGLNLFPYDENLNVTWRAHLIEASSEDGVHSLKVGITIPAHCPVTEWKLEVDTKLQSGGALSYQVPSNIFILFNPWCLQDQVYLSNEEERQEYVMEQQGIIWRGSSNRLRPVPWVYAQFERDVLECAMYVASKVGKVSVKARSDPVRLVRALSAAVNSPDDNGVVYGNWGTEFGRYTPPTKWVGSMKILQEYLKTKKPVKYGQCWVFSGVLCTVCRALGIPTRTVTNYSSAHDTQGSLTVDYFVDSNGEKMEELNSDSIWNFHVWNEVWMDRPDLGEQYGGWQVIDATPQELSDEMYRCGPTSVAAIKLGEVLRPYDGGFVFAEVNADKVYWKYSGPLQPLKLIRKDMFGIGHMISTKGVGTNDREDITANYKYPERSAEERLTMFKALQQSESMFSRYYLNEDFNDIKFEFELRDDIKIGEPFSVVLVMRNRSRETHKVTVVLRVETQLYTGRHHDLVKRLEESKEIAPESLSEVRLPVTFDEYYKKLTTQCFFNIACMATVADTSYEYFAQDDFRVRKPDIKIKLLDVPEEDVECTADLSLENPLPLPLKNAKFYVEGPGIVEQLKIKLKETVPVGGFAKTQIKFTPKSTGRQTLTAKFESKELDDVDGFISFQVVPNKALNEIPTENET